MQNSRFLSNWILSDLSEALDKMKGVYEQNPQMGDPASLEPQISETSQKMSRLKGELNKYEVLHMLEYIQITGNRFWPYKKIFFMSDVAVGSSWRRGIAQ